MKFDALIVGAGHAGAQTAIALRQFGFVGSVAIVGEEPEQPYERPPLSKDYLAGEKAFERMLIRPAKFWAERNVTMLTGHRVESVDAAAKRVMLRSGLAIGYGDLVWAAGGDARQLACAGGNLRGVHTIRNRANVDAIRIELADADCITVVGGGYIGLEAAAVLAKLGKRVTVLEALPRLLARVAGAPLSEFYAAEHRSQGVDIRLGATVEQIAGDQRAEGVRLADGSTIDADLVIVGIGIVPTTQPLSAAGADGSNGIDVDDFCATSLPNVFAVGDCAAHVSDFAGGARVRLESVQNAHDQAVTAARAIAGVPERHCAVPWFWSNQYDLRLQTVGLSAGHDAFVLRGDPAARTFAIVYLKAGRVIALDCVNAARDYVQGRRLVEAGARIEQAQLADISKPLKDIAIG